ncbi:MULTISPECIES: DUF4349 domain-containing protein [unclassified Leucobacter]|uniref:DUF4349 domain-containing protein n=1 Tax=unclassified Leucobacter TaxID=2621730 RepID=UPI00165DDAA5|nr:MULTISPECIES: DUF4349 domain-containing protein [unclassified Leucobacter]MBC9926558.1 DUF4349 domain-containing protein [Leucobacter sp. cx-169]
MTRLRMTHRTASRARLASVGLVAALALMLAGCAFGGPSGGPTGGSAESMPQTEALQDLAASPELATVDGKSAATGESIIRTSDVVIEVSDPQAAADDVVAALKPLDGRVEFSSVGAAGEWGPASASLTVRVPSDRLEDAITAISGVGKVVSTSRSTSDVTLQRQDLSARVAALTVSTERLRALMAEASNTADLIAAESALTARQAELDGLTSQLDYLDNQVDEATISVTLNAPGTAPVSGPENFWEAILLGISSLGAAIVGLGLALGVALPWIIAIALIVGIVVTIVRAARRPKA